ncbi:sigma-70 family RNA polymerase sigma factor [Telmatocola sphagniphila]|uniref:Sigma-70 family RNA polymerase sigma factor n=2 Tax=Telmatocola sphagniphila TaxID=1123043 RepID=A0A8E6BAW5_9BACT|nr:sigma-70 family RNA polymerase sigma factor [Telmatocola sphagniphila]
MDSEPPAATSGKADFAELYNQHSRIVWSLAYSRWMDSDLASDIMQESFLRLWKYLEAGEEEIQNPRAWLLRVARNLAEDQGKSSFRRHGTQGPEVFNGLHGKQLTPDTIIEQQETFARLREELKLLPEADRDILVLRYALDAETDQIAEILGVQPSAVHMRLSRARQRLAEQLKAKGWNNET